MKESNNWSRWIFYLYIFFHALSGLGCLFIPASYVKIPFADRTLVLFGNGTVIVWELKIWGILFLGSAIFLVFKSRHPPIFLQFMYECLCFYQIAYFNRISNILMMQFNILISLWNITNIFHDDKISSYLNKSSFRSKSKGTIMVSIFRLAISLWLSVVLLMCIVKADFSVVMSHDTDISTFKQATSFYCEIFGTSDNPSLFASLPNEIILSLMVFAGWFLYMKFSSRITLLSALMSSFVIINALPTYWMLKDVCSAREDSRSSLLSGAIMHLLGMVIVNTSILMDSINLHALLQIKNHKK